MKADILLTHPDYLFVHKPSGMLTISDRFDAQAPTLMALVQQQEPGVLLLHRLDRDTSGVIAYARHAEAQRHAAKLFETRAVEKIYLGIVQGSVTEVDGLIDAPIAEHPYHKGRMIVHHPHRLFELEMRG